MRSKTSKQCLNAEKLGMVVKSGPELKVGRHVQPRIQPASGAIPERPSPEGRLLLDPSPPVGALRGEIASPDERVPAEAAGKIDGHRLPVLIPTHRMHARQPVDFRKRRKDLCDDRQGPGRVLVVTVEPRHDVSGRPRKSLVDGVVLALVRLADPIGQPVGVAPDDRCAAVRRTPVDDHVLHVWIGLAEHRLHGFLQELRLVEGGSHDGNGRTSLSHDDGRQRLCPGIAASAGFVRPAVRQSRKNDAVGICRLP